MYTVTCICARACVLLRYIHNCHARSTLGLLSPVCQVWKKIGLKADCYSRVRNDFSLMFARKSVNSVPPFSCGEGGGALETTGVCWIELIHSSKVDHITFTILCIQKYLYVCVWRTFSFPGVLDHRIVVLQFYVLPNARECVRVGNRLSLIAWHIVRACDRSFVSVII